MYFKRIYDEGLAQASYLIGCQDQGAAAVVDPRRDIGVYLDEAARNGLDIVAVTETHIHADYLSGARELAAATGATLYLSDEGGADWQYRFDHEPLHDGSHIRLGWVTLTARHTPGHTPEHLSFLITDGATADEPGIVLTGDFVFVGDVGRPDLLDEAAGGQDSRFRMARQLFASLAEVFVTLPDYLQVWPGHGAGSACGKSLGAVAGSTVGYERRFAWWAGYVANGDEQGFVAELLEGQPEAPSYFGRMKRQNRQGPPLLGQRAPLTRYQGDELQEFLRGGARLVDTRAREAYLSGTVPGSLYLPAGKGFAERAAWILDPETDPRPLVLLTDGAEQAEALRAALAGIGVDEVAGFADRTDSLPRTPVATLGPAAIDELDDPYILDVRSRAEYQAGHIPGATRIHGGQVMARRGELPRDRPIVIHCQAGTRSSVVGSALRAAGFDNVLELAEGYQAWERQRAGSGRA